MSGSSQYGKLYTALIVRKLHELGTVRKILDIGAGAGTYSDLVRAQMPDSEWHAVEVWEPYLAEHGLAEKYDHVHNIDARQFQFDACGGPVDLVFCGDVMEHMEKDEAITLMDRFLDNAKMVLISIPIVHYPQDEVHGNPYERHVKDDWSNKEVHESFDGICATFLHDHIGVYLLTRDETVLPTIRAVHAAAAELVENNLSDDRIAWA